MLNIEQLRKEKGMSVVELAEKLGISRQHVYYLQNGERTPTVNVGLKLAKVLGVCPYELFEEEK